MGWWLCFFLPLLLSQFHSHPLRSLSLSLPPSIFLRYSPPHLLHSATQCVFVSRIPLPLSLIYLFLTVFLVLQRCVFSFGAVFGCCITSPLRDPELPHLATYCRKCNLRQFLSNSLTQTHTHTVQYIHTLCSSLLHTPSLPLSSHLHVPWACYLRR